MVKIAELPGGKRLHFDDNITDKEMRRAVRKELGLDKGDMIDAMETLGSHVREAGEHFRDNHKERLNEVADLLEANGHRIAGELASELSDAIKGIIKAQDKHASDVTKALSKHADLIINLRVTMEALNKTLGTSLLLSKETRTAIRTDVQLRALPPQPVKGVDQPVEIFTIAS